MALRHRDAQKRARQSERRRARNHATLARLRTLVKKARAAALAGTTSSGEASAAIAAAISALDRAAGKGVIHRNTAARTASRLARLAGSAA